MSKTPSSAIAGCFALSAFAVAVVAGLAAQNPASSILVRALIAMIVCYPVGLIIGLICQRLMFDHIAAHQKAASITMPNEAGKSVQSSNENTQEDSDDILVA